MRAINDLADLDDGTFLDEVATGLGYLAEVIAKIDVVAKSFAAPGFTSLINPGVEYPGTILSIIGEEEAAKVLILLDAVRCPLSKDKERRRTLSYFYDHVAKSIYAESCQWYPANFAEVMRSIEHERPKWYLDGPTGTDWIFYNSNLQRREDGLYVGYEREESDGIEKKPAYWRSPLHSFPKSHLLKNVFSVCRALEKTGMLSRDALPIIASIWRQKDLQAVTTSEELARWNLETLNELEKGGLLRGTPDDILRTVVNDWIFPLWSIDVGKPSEAESKKLRKTLMSQKGGSS